MRGRHCTRKEAGSSPSPLISNHKTMTTLDIVIPGLNEEKILANTVDTLSEFVTSHMADYDWRIVIADNGSTDATQEIGRRLAGQSSALQYLRLEQRGRGRALKHAWTQSDADVMAYMDMDLATGLAALPTLADAIARDGNDVAFGSRLKRGAEVIGRSPKREFISRCYSLIFRSMFFTGFVDAQCGFKAVSRRVVEQVLPLVEDTGWFFDTELLILCEKNGYGVREIPVRWVDDPDSRVRIVSTAIEDMKGLLRLRFGGLRESRKILRRHSGGGRNQQNG